MFSRFCVVACLIAAVSVCDAAIFNIKNHRGAMNSRLHRELLSGSPDLHDGPQAQYFDQVLDHNDPLCNITFKQKYYVNDQYWTGPGGPIFYVLGGEGPVSNHYVTNHFATGEQAEKFGALIVAMEHRFYGETIPGNDSSTANLKYLSSQQALADSAAFHHIITKQYQTPDSRWVVIGGSYSGSLAAWLRQKYPHLFAGALAASGPIKAQLDFPEYFEVVAKSIGVNCSQSISAAYSAITAKLQSTDGRTELQQIFNTCTPIISDLDVAMFMGALSNGIAGVVQYNDDNNSYQPCDIPVMCQMLSLENGADPMKVLAAFNNYYNNFTSGGQQTCLEVNYQQYIKESQATSDGRSWTYQTCTEFGYYQTGSSSAQPFSPLISLQSFLQTCADMFGIPNMTPNIEWTNEYYGSTGIQTTNTVFTSGSVDPWHILALNHPERPLGPGTSIIPMRGTAHCADLYPPRDSDLSSLTLARSIQEEFVTQWLSQ